MADPINCSNTSLPTTIDFEIDVRTGSLVSLIDLSVVLFLTPASPTAGPLPWDQRRVEFFKTLSSVASRYGTESEPYRAAYAFFSQDPRPTQMAIGQVFTTAQTGSMTTLPVPTSKVTDGTDGFGGITDGAFNISYGIQDETTSLLVELTGLDFTGDATSADVAATLQAEIRAVTDGPGDVTVTATDVGSNTYFTFGAAFPGDNSTVSVLSSPSSSSNVTDISGSDYLNGQNGNVINGYTPGDVADELQLCLEAAVCQGTTIKRWVIDGQYRDQQAQRDVADWTETQDGAHFFAASQDPNNKDPTDESSNAYTFFDEEYKNTYIEAVDILDNYQYNDMAMAAIMLSTNYDAPDSILNAKFRTYVNLSTTNVADEIQLNGILSKRANVFTNVGGIVNCTRDGTTSSPLWYLDDKLGVDNFVNDLIEALYIVFTRIGRIPYTTQGQSILANAINRVGNKYTRAGLFADRTVESNTNVDGTRLLPAFAITFQDLATVTPADRAARILPGTVITVQLAGGINELRIEVVADS